MSYIQEAVSDGTLDELALSIEYFSRAEITVSFDGVVSPEGDSQWNWLGTTSTTLQFTPAVANGVTVTVERRTAVDAMRHDFSAGAQFRPAILDENFEQLRRVVEEDRPNVGVDASELPATAPAGLTGSFVQAILNSIGAKFVSEAAAWVAAIAASAASAASALAASTGAALIGIAGGRTVADALTGSTSDVGYATLQAAVTAAAGSHLRITRTWNLTATVVVDSNTSIELTPGSLVTTSTPNISLFSATGKVNVHFMGFGKLSQTGAAGASAYIAAILFDSSSNCTVKGYLEFAGFQWCGVYMVNAVHCKVRGGYFHDWLGSVNDSGAVMIHQNSTDCIVEGIHAKATGWWGALIQDPGGAGVYAPLRNKIRNCRIEDTKAYGAALYLGAAGNSYNEITGCTITGVLGTAGAGQFGMGIYAVGAGLGGCKVTGNSVSNCCINQTVTTNGYAGIVVTGNAPGYVKPIVAGNSVDGMVQGGGIQIISMLGGCVVGHNSAHIPATNLGAGPGGAGMRGMGLLVWNCNDVSVAAGDYVNLGNGAAILLYASSDNYTGITLTVGNARSAAGIAVLVQRTGAYTITGSIHGGTAKASDDGAPGMQLVGFSGTVGGVTVINGATAAATAALACTGCPSVRFSDMVVSSPGTYSVSIGSSTGVWDKNSSHTGRFESTSSTFRTEFYSAGIPTVGTFQIGDRAVNSSVVVGTAKAWIRATAGSAHALGVDWISEGNL